MANKATGFRLGKVKTTISTNLNKKFINRIQQTLEKQMNEVQRVTVEESKKVIREHVQNHRVVKALQGNYAAWGSDQDLQAEFGLSNNKAQKAVTIIIQVLSNTVKAKDIKKRFIRRGTQAQMELRINALQPKNYLQILRNWGSPLNYISTSYVSQARKRGYKREGMHRRIQKNNIDWMKWLLEATRETNVIKESIPDIRFYGITYDLRKRDHSRSKRAVMVKGRAFARTFQQGRGMLVDGEFQTTGMSTVRFAADPPSHRSTDRFPYTFPKLAVPRKGRRNFVDEIVRSTEFRRDVSQRVRDRIQKLLKS